MLRIAKPSMVTQTSFSWTGPSWQQTSFSWTGLWRLGLGPFSAQCLRLELWRRGPSGQDRPRLEILPSHETLLCPSYLWSSWFLGSPGPLNQKPKLMAGVETAEVRRGSLLFRHHAGLYSLLRESAAFTARASLSAHWLRALSQRRESSVPALGWLRCSLGMCFLGHSGKPRMDWDKGSLGWEGGRESLDLLIQWITFEKSQKNGPLAPLMTYWFKVQDEVFLPSSSLPPRSAPLRKVHVSLGGAFAVNLDVRPLQGCGGLPLHLCITWPVSLMLQTILTLRGGREMLSAFSPCSDSAKPFRFLKRHLPHFLGWSFLLGLNPVSGSWSILPWVAVRCVCLGLPLFLPPFPALSFVLGSTPLKLTHWLHCLRFIFHPSTSNLGCTPQQSSRSPNSGGPTGWHGHGFGGQRATGCFQKSSESLLPTLLLESLESKLDEKRMFPTHIVQGKATSLCL